jgi:hypothetical protein
VTFTIRWPSPAVTSFACGDGAMIADCHGEWFVDRACDGFILVPPTSPPPLTSSLMRSCLSCKSAASSPDYSGSTLRDHLGLPVAKQTPPTDIQSARVAHGQRHRRPRRSSTGPASMSSTFRLAHVVKWATVGRHEQRTLQGRSGQPDQLISISTQ